jgi:hypothetical protein
MIMMMARTQITLDPEMQRRARKRATELGISLAEYVRVLLARDLGAARATPAIVFDLGSSRGADVARHKDSMLAEAYSAGRRKPRRRSA